jgi:hypothetical protein
MPKLSDALRQEIIRQVSVLGHEQYKKDQIAAGKTSVMRGRAHREDPNQVDLLSITYDEMSPYWKEQNNATGNVVAGLIGEAVENEVPLDEIFAEGASAEVHVEWMKANKWREKEEPELFVPFAQLTKFMQDLDRLYVRIGIQVYNENK